MYVKVIVNILLFNLTPLNCRGINSSYKKNLGNNVLIFSNKTEADIILKDEFEAMLGKNFINVITDEPGTEYHNKRIDKKFLEGRITDFSQRFYVCGPDEFTKNILDALKELGADAETLVFEK